MYRRLERISLQLEELGLTHEKNYDMMLRRLAGGADIHALRTLVDILEPVKIYNRNRLRKHFSFTPLTRVVDAARPDAEVARHFRKSVDTYLRNPREHDEEKVQISTMLKRWAENHAKLEPLIRRSPILWEVEKHSKNLSLCADIGLQSIKLLEAGNKADGYWLTESRKALDAAKTPYGQTELMILPAIEKLLAAAGQTE